MTAGRIWWYVVTFDLAAEGAVIEIVARCTSEEKARAYRVARRLSPSRALVRSVDTKIAPGRYSGRTLDEEIGLRAGRLVRCFLAVDG